MSDLLHEFLRSLGHQLPNTGALDDSRRDGMNEDDSQPGSSHSANYRRSSPSGSTLRSKYDREEFVINFLRQPFPHIVKPDGFLDNPIRFLLINMVFDMRYVCVQEYVEFGETCDMCRALDRLLLAVSRPRQWRLLDGNISLPKGYVRITPQISRSLTSRYDAITQQAFLKLVTIETLVEICEMLRVVLQPMVEAFLSGSLQLTERLPTETVALLSPDHRAALITEFRKMLPLVKKQEQTVESLIDWSTAIDIALESVGRPTSPIAPYRPSLHEKRGKRNLSLMPLAVESLFVRLEAGTLALNLLSEFNRGLRVRATYAPY